MINSIFPYVDIEKDLNSFKATFDKNNKENLPIFKELDYDFKNNKIILDNYGNPKIVKKNEALKVWIYKALTTDRFIYSAYSWNYGTELRELIGKGVTDSYIQTEAERFTKESLLINPYITGIYNFNISWNKDKLFINCIVKTLYGEVEIANV